MKVKSSLSKYICIIFSTIYIPTYCFKLIYLQAFCIVGHA